jgi:hypothetical protein
MTDIEVTNWTEPANDPPSERELAFRDMQRNPRAWSRWCAETRARWAGTPAGLLAARRLKGDR